MANVYGHNQWILDTAGVVTTDRIRISRMEYHPSATNDDLTIHDNNGEVFWAVLNAVGADATGMVPFTPSKPQDIEGFDLEAIGGGKLYVWLA